MTPNHYDAWVASLRPAKRLPPMDRPIAAFVERELLPTGRCVRVGTILLNNRECPYRCVFCGLWQDTIDDTPRPDAVARQVEQALTTFGEIDAVKLYNAGSFFDEQAIPSGDRDRIAALCRSIEWVIVESRPELIDERAVRFANALKGTLEIAIGLEIADDPILALMNKRMTLGSVRRAGRFLTDHGIALRTFIMVQPPFVSPERAVPAACETARFAHACGARTVTLIRAHATPGAMQWLAHHGYWAPPDPWAVYDAARTLIAESSALTLVDRWSLDRDPSCAACTPALDAAFDALNTRQDLPAVTCACRAEYEASLGRATVRSADEYRDFLKEMARTTRSPTPKLAPTNTP